MQRVTLNRLVVLLAACAFLPVSLRNAHAQEDPNDTPLGDVARTFRKKVGPSELVIDNDNFSKVVDEAESHRVAGSTMTFTLDPGAKNFRVSTPDASCTLSFTGKTSALLSDPVMLDELPREELSKLDGPAEIEGDSLQLSIHNGSAWELREVVIGLTIVRTSDAINSSSYYNGPARVVPAVANYTRPLQDPSQKQPDTTVLLRVKGSAAPSSTALFRTQLNFALFPDQEWHWAIVRAKGVPPQPSVESAPSQTAAQSEQSPAPVQANTPALPSTPLVSEPTPAPNH